MKKIILFILISTVCFTGCSSNETKQKAPFAGDSWVRTAEHDTETISFDEDGTFHYSCTCGNPVNNADICDKYTYNDETKEIKLKCYEEVDDTITTIGVVNYDNNTLELDFDGEIRKFNKE